MGRRVRKFLRGQPITSVAQLAAEVLDKRSYVFFYNRPMHFGWIRSMQLGYLAGLIAGGKLHLATVNPEWRESEKTE